MRAWTVGLALALVACGDDPEVDPLGIEGAVFALDVGAMRIPGADPAIVTVIQSFFGGDMWMHTHGVSDGGFGIRTGFAGADGAQDPCMPTSELPRATLDDTRFAFGPEDAEFQTTAGIFVFEGFEGAGQFSARNPDISDMTLQGVVDMRALQGFGGLGDGDLLCRMLASYGMPCGPCGDDEPFCVPLEIEKLDAPRIDESFRVIAFEEVEAACASEE